MGGARYVGRRADAGCVATSTARSQQLHAKLEGDAQSCAPSNDSAADGCFISNSYDATSHFESVATDVLRLYKDVVGEELDMTISADTTEADE